MQAKVLPFKPLARVKRTNETSKIRTSKRFSWITDTDMEEINEVDARGRGYDYTDHRKEE